MEEKEFYDTLNSTLIEYNILTGDTCTRDSMGKPIPNVTGGFEACENHLEESFNIFGFV